jgi:hypothetical protein
MRAAEELAKLEADIRHMLVAAKAAAASPRVP